MQAISSALNRLLEDGSWFVRAKEVNLFVVKASADLRKPALKILGGLEFHHDNRSAWVLFEEAYTRADSGWQVRAHRLLAHWEDRRAAFLKNEGIEMPSAPAPALAGQAGLLAHLDAGSRTARVAPFRGAAGAVATALRPPLEGLVLVLAPTIVEEVDALGNEIELLIKDPATKACRWVLLVDAAEPRPALLDRLDAKHWLQCDCVPDPKQHDKDLRALVYAPNPSFAGAAPRGVNPPRRVDDPPPVDPAVVERTLKEAGLSSEYLAKAPDLQRLVLGAALAMKEGKGVDAIRMQREARDLAASLGLAEVTVICQVSLASYLSGLNQRDLALTELRSAIELATRHDLGLQEAQARLALALLLSLQQRLPEAAREYAACATRAEKANVPLIAIEAWRLAAQLALQVKAEPQAISCFSEAIRVAVGSEKEMVKVSSAPEAARRLAALCRERGLIAQAESLYTQADAMERAEVGVDAAAQAEE
ncbi:hypothetical protein [Polyangium fumosum]|uniref:Tetratricopeptide repeat protein n=1 Tax=Polyangium fumosum TaxID=889272 RepID=A0A4V5PLR8_9BACT|nr:hypothetical protein [Polyangium fumosum]TKC93340.1 hypothetical protein E8A74_49670 [Polyangium fumosum]